MDQPLAVRFRYALIPVGEVGPNWEELGAKILVVGIHLPGGICMGLQTIGHRTSGPKLDLSDVFFFIFRFPYPGSTYIGVWVKVFTSEYPLHSYHQEWYDVMRAVGNV
jgi:hypothetical protein